MGRFGNNLDGESNPHFLLDCYTIALMFFADLAVAIKALTRLTCWTNTVVLGIYQRPGCQLVVLAIIHVVSKRLSYCSASVSLPARIRLASHRCLSTALAFS